MLYEVITADGVGIDVAVVGGVDDQNLLLDRHRLVLSLLENLDQTGAAIELTLGGGVEA